MSTADAENIEGSNTADQGDDVEVQPKVDLGALRREREQRQKQMSKKRERSISPPPTKRDTNKAPRLDSTTQWRQTHFILFHSEQ
jgi:hypothetical protein